MGHPSTHEITQLLVAWNQGDQAALEALSPLIKHELRWQELRRLANQELSRKEQER